MKKIKFKNFFICLTVVFLLFMMPMNDFIYFGLLNTLFDLKVKITDRYVNKLQMAMDEEQILLGSSEKYTFKTPDGKKWLYKVFLPHERIKAWIAYTISGVLNMKTPDLYNYEIFVNDTKKNGILQEFITEGNQYSTAALLREYPKNKKVITANSKFEMFTFMLNFENDDVELIMDENEELYLIDLDNALSEADNNELLEQPSIKEAAIDLETIKVFIWELNRLNEKRMRKYVQNKMIYYGYNETDAEHHLDSFFGRTKQIKDLAKHRYGFKDEYFNNVNMFHVYFNRIKNAYESALKLVSYICYDVIQNGKDAKSKIFAISSGEAWYYLMYNYHDEFEKSRPYEIPVRIENKLTEAEIHLAALRQKYNDPHEKLAISLYITQLKTFKGYLKKYDAYSDYCSFDFVRFIVPIINDPVSMKDPENEELWQKTNFYKKRGPQETVMTEEERRFIYGLFYLIKENNSMALEYFKEARSRGYAVTEIDSLLKDIKVNEVVK